MTKEGVKQLYMYLGAAWPLVIKPGVDEKWKQAKLVELYNTYREYEDGEVQRAFQKWTEENDKYPTTKNIINEIKWARVMAGAQGRENEELWQAPIWKDGQEWLIMSGGTTQWRRTDFLEQRWNRERLQPEEWERRFLETRRRAIANV